MGIEGKVGPESLPYQPHPMTHRVPSEADVGLSVEGAVGVEEEAGLTRSVEPLTHLDLVLEEVEGGMVEETWLEAQALRVEKYVVPTVEGSGSEEAAY